MRPDSASWGLRNFTYQETSTSANLSTTVTTAIIILQYVDHNTLRHNIFHAEQLNMNAKRQASHSNIDCKLNYLAWLIYMRDAPFKNSTFMHLLQASQNSLCCKNHAKKERTSTGTRIAGAPNLASSSPLS
jgi:hypothetical protein